MTIHVDPKEERAHARALVHLMEHVGPCGDCAERVRSSSCPHGRKPRGASPPLGPITDEQIAASFRLRCNGLIRQEEGRADAFCIADAGHDGPCDEGCRCCGHALFVDGVNATTGWCLECSGPAKPSVLDLSDANVPLCARGSALRAAAISARSNLPAERLIRFYALEGTRMAPRALAEGPGDDDEPDDDDEDDDDDAWVEIPVADAHDCARGAAWLREDPGRARAILTQLEDRAGPLEERDAPVAALREGFLVGFRKVSPSRGPAPTDEQKIKRAAAADRLVALVVERYENRHGAPPPADVVAAFRRVHDMWIDGAGDLERMAADAEKFRATHAKRWTTKALLSPKDPLAEMRKIARWIAEGLIGEEASKG